MTTRMSLWQVLTTPLSLCADPNEARDHLAHRLLRRCEREIRRVRRERLEAVRRSGIIERAPDALRSDMDRLVTLAKEERLLARLHPKAPAAPVLTFSSWLLRDSYRICVETPEEGMHFVVGVCMDGVMVGTNIVTFPYARRSVAGAAGETRATHRISIEAAESGHSIVAILHSHPGMGPEANHPSPTDLRTHALWERSMPLVGGIWSRDGFLRFFTSGASCRVEVLGDHLESSGDNLWRLRDEYAATR